MIRDGQAHGIGRCVGASAWPAREPLPARAARPNRIGLEAVKRGLHVDLHATGQARALAPWTERTPLPSGPAHGPGSRPRLSRRCTSLYFSGGSTGRTALTDAPAVRFARTRRASGERFFSVVQGPAIGALRRFAPTRAGS